MNATPTPQQTIALLKHLVGGKTIDQVALILHLPAATVREYATTHGYPDNAKMEWAIDELVKQANTQATTLPPGRPIPRPTPQFATGTTTSGGGTLTIGPSNPDDIRLLLNTAKGHPSKRIQTAADRVFDQLDRLKALIREDEEKHSEKRKAEEKKAKLRAEVAELEAKLAAAKAKLRGKPAPAAATAKAPKAPRTPTGETYPCRHDGCDKAYDTPQGRSLHERMKCDHNPLRAAS